MCPLGKGEEMTTFPSSEMRNFRSGPLGTADGGQFGQMGPPADIDHDFSFPSSRRSVKVILGICFLFILFTRRV